MSNLKQIGLGIMQYTQDYDETYPINYASDTVTSGISAYAFWMVRTYPYIKNTQVLVCPSAAKATEVPATYNFPDLGQVRFTGARNGNYGINEFVIRFASTTVPTPVTLSAISSPSLLPLGFDSTMATASNVWRIINANVATQSGTPNIFTPGPPMDESLARHLNGSNLLYADGHVKFLSQGQMGPSAARASQPSDIYRYGIPLSLADDRVK